MHTYQIQTDYKGIPITIAIMPNLVTWRPMIEIDLDKYFNQDDIKGDTRPGRIMSAMFSCLDRYIAENGK